MKKLRIIIVALLSRQEGQSLIELLMAIGLMAIIIPALSVGFIASRNGKPQQQMRIKAIALMKETQEAVRIVREAGWSTFSTNGTYHPVQSGNSWTFSSGSETTSDGFTRYITVGNVERDSNGAIVQAGGTVDPSTKRVDIAVSWTQPVASSMSAVMYMTRYLDNLSFTHTTQTEFDTGTKIQTVSTNTSGGEVVLSDNNKAKWCEPEFASSTIDLPDGPPVAVAAKAQSSTSIPNDVFVATAPTATSSVKLAYVNVPADVDVPTSTLRGTFTLDSTKYSSAGLVPSGLGIDNNFKTNDVAYYTSSSNKTYALLGTNLTDKEVIAVLVNDGNDATDTEYQDPVNKIYKYKTFFNTIPYKISETGFKDPSANAADSGGDGNGYDSNPTRAYSNNASFAVDNNSGNGTGTNCTGADKDKHRFYNYGFTVSSGATINGIQVQLDAKADSTNGNPTMCVQLSWDGGTTWTTAKSTSTLTTSEVSYTLGGTADTWGRTWSSSDFSNANFRVRVIDVSSDTNRDFSLDWVTVNVHFNGGTPANNDQSPFGYGGVTITTLEDKGYVASGGYLYVFDLSTIDSKSATDGLDMVGCRIELDGYECQPGNGTDRKYSSGESNTTWSSTTTPANAATCADGGNIELYATNDIYPVKVGTSTYIYAAVGAGTNPELNIVNVSSEPTTSSSPTVSSNSCGRFSGGNSSWKLVGQYDFNTASGTQEAANSVFAKSDGTRAYISSNGGSDSKQFYIINTTTKTAPAFLSGSNNGTGPTSGYYSGSGANGELYPRRSMTVLNGQRVVLVGSDGVTNSNDAEEYQVLNSSTEATPTYCSGINFNSGFNDLTSVVEADSDTFVYMVANTSVNELKIIQGGPDGRYFDSGTIESATYDVGYSTAFNRFTATVSRPSGTDIGWQFAVADPVAGSCTGASYVFTGPGGTSASTDLYTATGSAILWNNDGTGYENPGRCFRYKGYFTTTDYNATPQLNDITVNLSP